MRELKITFVSLPNTLHLSKVALGLKCLCDFLTLFNKYKYNGKSFLSSVCDNREAPKQSDWPSDAPYNSFTKRCWPLWLKSYKTSKQWMGFIIFNMVRGLYQPMTKYWDVVGPLSTYIDKLRMWWRVINLCQHWEYSCTEKSMNIKDIL